MHSYLKKPYITYYTLSNILNSGTSNYPQSEVWALCDLCFPRRRDQTHWLLVCLKSPFYSRLPHEIKRLIQSYVACNSTFYLSVVTRVLMIGRGIDYKEIPVGLRRTAWAIREENNLSEQTTWLLVATFHPLWKGLPRGVRKIIQKYVVLGKHELEMDEKCKSMLDTHI